MRPARPNERSSRVTAPYSMDVAVAFEERLRTSQEIAVMAVRLAEPDGAPPAADIGAMAASWLYGLLIGPLTAQA